MGHDKESDVEPPTLIIKPDTPLYKISNPLLGGLTFQDYRVHLYDAVKWTKSKSSLLVSEKFILRACRVSNLDKQLRKNIVCV